MAGAYDELERFYRDAGIPGWTVFVDPAGDESSAAVLAEHGHVLDAEPRLMGAPSTEVAGQAIRRSSCCATPARP